MSHCDNCSKKIVDDEHVACGHCLDATYCSRKCQAMGWEAHDCANALNVDHIESASVFVPYHFEDTLSLEAQEKLAATDPVRQTYSMQEVCDDMTIRSRIQGALIDEECPRVMQANHLVRGSGYADSGTYTIQVGTHFKIAGSMPRDMIFPDNKLNARAKTLGGGRIQAATSRWARSAESAEPQTFVDTRDTLIFWPGTERVYAEKADLPLEGLLHVKLATSGNVVKELSGHYDFLHETRKPSEAVRKNMNAQMEPRIASVLDSTKDLRTIQCTDSQGNRAVVTALIGEDSARLVDVEFLAPAATLNKEQDRTFEYTERRMECDPEDINQLVGLAMGLELHTKSGRSENPRLVDLCATVSRYAQDKMDRPKEFRLTPEMSSAVDEAVETMHDELIGARRRWGTNPFKSASKYGRRFRSSRQVARAAKRVKRGKDSEATKTDKLQVMYDGRLELAEREQQNGGPGTDYLDQAEIIYSVAAEDTRKSPAILLNSRTDKVDALRANESVLLDKRYRKKDEQSEYDRYMRKDRRRARREERKRLDDYSKSFEDGESSMFDDESE